VGGSQDNVVTGEKNVRTTMQPTEVTKSRPRGISSFQRNIQKEAKIKKKTKMGAGKNTTVRVRAGKKTERDVKPWDRRVGSGGGGVQTWTLPRGNAGRKSWDQPERGGWSN